MKRIGEAIGRALTAGAAVGGKFLLEDQQAAIENARTEKLAAARIAASNAMIDTKYDIERNRALLDEAKYQRTQRNTPTALGLIEGSSAPIAAANVLLRDIPAGEKRDAYRTFLAKQIATESTTFTMPDGTVVVKPGLSLDWPGGAGAGVGAGAGAGADAGANAGETDAERYARTVGGLAIGEPKKTPESALEAGAQASAQTMVSENEALEKLAVDAPDYNSGSFWQFGRLLPAFGSATFQQEYAMEWRWTKALETAKARGGTVSNDTIEASMDALFPRWNEDDPAVHKTKEISRIEATLKTLDLAVSDKRKKPEAIALAETRYQAKLTQANKDLEDIRKYQKNNPKWYESFMPRPSGAPQPLPGESAGWTIKQRGG